MNTNTYTHTYTLFSQNCNTYIYNRAFEMPKTLMERLTLTHIKIIFQNTKSQKLPAIKQLTF